MKNRTLRIRFVVVFLSGLLLSGCGHVDGDAVPTLKEPVAANAAYRPVEKGVIGETKVLYGTVAPMEYCCFYDSSVAIKEITVEVGDYIKEGDIIAYADIDLAKEQLESLNLQLENAKLNYEINTKISQLDMEQIASKEVPVVDVSGNQLPARDVSENRIDVEATEELKAVKETNIARTQENIRYDGILYNYRVDKLQEEMEKQRSIITRGTLKASHSGYVVYAKNLGKSTYAEAYENIVVIADPEETYIELTDRTIDKYAYEDYEVKYLCRAGKTYDVTEMSYSVDAEVLAKASGRYPNVRLTCPDAEKLVVGETYPVLYREKNIADVPIIGLDSLYGEKDAYFVYVKNADGDREKRSVTIGEYDSYYAQVLSGLEIGDEVYYESDARMPAAYTEYTVELSDYRIENISRTYGLADEQVYWYDTECAGTILEVVVEEDDEVQAGDLLYVIRSDAGKAALAAAQNDIARENTAYEETIKQINKMLETERDEKSQQILVLQKELENINHLYRLSQLEKIYNDMAENNNGNGEIRVYAKQSGVVTRIVASKDSTVAEGSHVLSIGNVASDKLLVQMEDLSPKERNYPNNIAEFGEDITITVGEEVYEGICTGRTAHADTNLEKYYISETEDGAVISFCSDSGYHNPGFYVEMEDESFYQNVPKTKGRVNFSYVAMEDVIVVPTAIVKEEENEKNPTKKDYFVWRVEGDELVKQYVLINKAYSDLNVTVILSGVEEKDILARGK